MDQRDYTYSTLTRWYGPPEWGRAEAKIDTLARAADECYALSDAAMRHGDELASRALEEEGDRIDRVLTGLCWINGLDDVDCRDDLAAMLASVSTAVDCLDCLTANDFAECLTAEGELQRIAC